MSKPITKKSHPHNLPHLKDARREDGTVNQAAVLEGAQAWAAKVASGEYEFLYVGEVAVNETDDVLTVIRRKVK